MGFLRKRFKNPSKGLQGIVENLFLLGIFVLFESSIITPILRWKEVVGTWLKQEGKDDQRKDMAKAC
jgi:hypothetical protein